jgi:hypothetical protein
MGLLIKALKYYLIYRILRWLFLRR